MTAYALHARYVVPVDHPPLVNGYVTIDQGRFLDCATRPPDCPIHELGHVALLPGLVNTHTHLEFSLLDAPLGSRGMPFTEWVRTLLAYRTPTSAKSVSEPKQPDTAAEPELAIETGVEECLRYGTTTVGEISTCPLGCYTAAARHIDLNVLVEVLAPAAESHHGAMDALRSQFDGLPAGATLNVGISPHSPYTVPVPVLEEVIALACRRHATLAMHLAETEDELQLLERGTGPLRELLVERQAWNPKSVPTGTRPLDYLTALSRAPRAVVAHGNFLRHDELRFLAEHRRQMSLVYCPRTHAYFEHPAYPLAEALGQGVRVALGTDSRASNPDLSLWSEVRFGADRHPDVAPEAWIRMATRDGATALGREAEAGAIVGGRPANLVAIRLPEPLTQDPLEDLVRAGDAVVATWFRGQPVSIRSRDVMPAPKTDSRP